MNSFFSSKPIRRAAIILGTAAFYYGTGRLGHLLAISPGYVTAVWMPAGIALAAALLWGVWALPGIWLGAFFIELYVSGYSAQAPQMAWVSAVIAVGAVLQAGFGAHLARRFAGFPSPLIEARDILLFLLLSGGVGCLVNASISVPLLVMAGKIAPQEARLNWLTWWLGDAIGVFVAAPLVFIVFGRPREVWRPRLLPVGGALALGMAVVVALFIGAKRREQANLQARFMRGAKLAAIFAQGELAQDPGGLTNDMRWVDASDYAWWVDAVDAGGVVRRVYAGAVPPEELAFQPATHYATAFEAGGRHWIFHTKWPRAAYASRQYEPLWEILIGGFALTGMLGAFVLVLTGRTRAVEAEVSERTARLVELNEMLEEEVAQRLHAEEATRVLNRELESRVRERTAELEAAREEAEMANQAKSAFLANISHEVRTPMNGVLGLAEILERSQLDHQQREWVKTLKSSGEAMIRILNDVLDLAKVESGQLALENAPFCPRHELAKAMGLLAAQAGQKGLVLHHGVDDAVPEALLGDALRMRQIFLNLAGNAIKFTAHGSVSVRVGVDGPPAGGALPGTPVALHLSVADTGVGISDDQFPKLFQPFVQGDSSITRRFGGTGLGLSIISRLAHLMGGRAWAENRAGGGSVFHVVCMLKVADCGAARKLPVGGRDSPQAAKAPAPAGVQNPASVRARSVLVVDDNAVNRMVAQTLLVQRGHRVALANDGAQALRMLAQESFDTVLMDIQMPGMDGFEALRHLREEEAVTRRRARHVVALTASAMRGDREVCLSVGFDGYVGKPFQPNELFEVVEWSGAGHRGE